MNLSNLNPHPHLILNDKIPHVKQQRFNDCGVACIKMVLKFIFNSQNRQVNEVDLENILKSINVHNKSLWTIDIAHVFAIYNIKHAMFTVTFGVLDSYSNENFYTKHTNFNEEQQRINAKFTQLDKLGINISKRSLSLDEIKQQFQSCCACIVLVDANILNGKNINNNTKNLNNLNDNETCLSCLTGLLKSKLGYGGHFIVLIGYDNIKKLIFYRNPSTNRDFSFTSEENFELARKSYGTDEDIVFVYL